MLRGNIAHVENLFSVKCDDKSNMNVFTLSLWENFRWGLIYFDQSIIVSIIYAWAKTVQISVTTPASTSPKRCEDNVQAVKLWME